MADLPLLAAKFFNHPHYVYPAYAETVAVALAHRFNVNPLSMKSANEDATPLTPRPARSPMLTKEGVYVLPVVGGLYHRGDSLDAMSGSQSYTNLNNMLLAALESPDVKGILLDMDSPGGQATGCFEFADTILDARKRKPIWSIANGAAFSAAYAIACSAEKFYCTPSGDVGSIGVVWMHRDVSEAMKQLGVNVTYVFAGKHKVDGNPFEPLPAAVRERIQADIDVSYQNFVDVVAARRPMTAKQIRNTEADTFKANEAVELGLVDEVASFSKVLATFSEELNRPKQFRVQPNGALAAMSGTPAPAASGNTPEVHGLNEALTRAREDGLAAGRAEADAREIAAYTKGRADAAAICGHENAAGRQASAVSFAANAKFSVEEAVGFLAGMPSGGKSFGAQLAEKDPDVPATQSGNGQSQSAVATMQSSVAGHVRQLLGVK